MHCLQGDVLSGEQELVTKEFCERFYILKYFSTFQNIFGGRYTHVFHSWAWVRVDVKSFAVKLKII